VSAAKKKGKLSGGKNISHQRHKFLDCKWWEDVSTLVGKCEDQSRIQFSLSALSIASQSRRLARLGILTAVLQLDPR
jgi:hypothetical protein